MPQENKPESDNRVSDFAKSRIRREKERLGAHTDGASLPYTPLPTDFPTEEEIIAQHAQTDTFEKAVPADGKQKNKSKRTVDGMGAGKKSDASSEDGTNSRRPKVIRYEDATEEEKEAYDTFLRTGEMPDDSFRVGRKKPTTKKVVLINPQWEKKRARALLCSRRIVTVLVLLVTTAAVISGISLLSDSHLSDRLRAAFYSESGNDANPFAFGPFEGYVTVGDSIERADELLGEPDLVYDSYRYYQKSYLIVRDGTVVGYYRDPREFFPVTVGFKGENASGRVMVGDLVSSVIYRLGSPDYYFGKNWLYLSCNGSARNDELPDTSFEVDFDDEGQVISCYAVKK